MLEIGTMGLMRRGLENELAVVLSLLQHVRRSYRPHTAVVVRDAAGNRSFEDPANGKMAEPGLVMFWFGADLFYAKVAFFGEQVRRLVHDSPSPVRWLVIDATAITGLDFSAGRAVAELQQDLAKAGVNLALVVVPVKHQADLERMGLIDRCQPDFRFSSCLSGGLQLAMFVGKRYSGRRAQERPDSVRVSCRPAMLS